MWQFLSVCVITLAARGGRQNINTVGLRMHEERKKLIEVHHCTDVYMSIKASGPHQSWIQDISSIGSSQNDHVGAAVEPWREERCDGGVLTFYTSNGTEVQTLTEIKMTAYRPFPQATGWVCFPARSGHQSSLSSCPQHRSRQWRGCRGRFFELWQTCPESNTGQGKEKPDLSCWYSDREEGVFIDWT